VREIEQTAIRRAYVDSWLPRSGSARLWLTATARSDSFGAWRGVGPALHTGAVVIDGLPKGSADQKHSTPAADASRIGNSCVGKRVGNGLYLAAWEARLELPELGLGRSRRAAPQRFQIAGFRNTVHRNAVAD